MKREGLAKQVYDLTHLSVHAGENYKKIADFHRIVSGFADKLRDLYSQASSDQDKGYRLPDHGDWMREEQTQCRERPQDQGESR